MCVTTVRLSNICGHTAVHTKVCKKKAGTSLFNVFRASCKPTKTSANYYEICHDCRRFWEARGISELRAQDIYRMYRDTHQYYGAGLTPHEWRKGEMPTLVRDRELEAGESVRPPSEVPEPIPESQVSDQWRGNLTRYLIELEEQRKTARPKSRGSSLTLWPTVEGDNQAQDENIAPPEDFEMHNIDQAVDEEITERGRSVLGIDDLPITRRKRVSNLSATVQGTGDIGDEYIPETDEFINHHRALAYRALAYRALTSSREMIDPEAYDFDRLDSPQDENGFETIALTPSKAPSPSMSFPTAEDQNQIWRSF
jgi:hypothetical protein